MELTQEESYLFRQLKAQHSPYFKALVYSASVILDRNKKYTGEKVTRDVFANFRLDAKIQGIAPSQTFKQWISKKVARIMINTEDFGDESFTDSLRDLANYALLWIGYLFLQETKKDYNQISKCT